MTPGRSESIEALVGPVSRETMERLELFERELERWGKRINLVAPSTLGAAWSRHVADSVQILPLARRDATRWVDLGSGGGLPGIVLAILLVERPGATIHLVESNAKKASFLQVISGELGLPASIHRRRIEDVTAEIGDVDIVTARALAPLDKLLLFARPWLANGATALFHKGRDYQREIEESRDRWRFDLVIHPDRVDPQGRVLQISALKSASVP